MGVCCVKQHNQDQGEFKSGPKTESAIKLFKDNKDAIEKIVKIQCAIRRYRAMKEVKQIRESKNRKHPVNIADGIVQGPVPEVPDAAVIEQHQHEFVPEAAQNLINDTASDNSKVRELEAKLGPYRPETRQTDNASREYRDTVILDNGAKYSGEW